MRMIFFCFILASPLAFAITAERLNRDGIGYIVADVTKPPEPGAVDVAPPQRVGATAGEAVASGVALGSSGALTGAGAVTGLLIDAASAPKTYNSSRRMYRVVYENNCKVILGFSATTETDVSLLVPGRPVRWIEPPSGRGLPVLTALLDGQQKALPPIDDKHPCFAKWAEELRKITKSAD